MKIQEAQEKILKLANQMNVDAEESLQNTLNEYEERMPSETMKKVKHANKLIGGVDNKDGKKSM